MVCPVQCGYTRGIGLCIGLGGVFLIAPAGCAGLKLQLVDHSVHKPSNVAVYFIGRDP